MMRKSSILRNFLDAVNVGAVGIMAAVLVVMTLDVVVDWRSIVIAAISLFVTFGIKKSNAMWTILGGAALGYVLSFV
jgi:chromate transporter